MRLSRYARDAILAVDGIRAFTEGPFFNEFAVRLSKPVRTINAALLKEGIVGGLDLGRIWPDLESVALFAVTETKTPSQIDRLAQALKRCLK